VLENQIKEMSQQLSAQRMQWPQASTPPPITQSPQRMKEHNGTESEVQKKLQFLSEQVEKVVSFATALQKHRESVGVVRKSGDVAMGCTHDPD
jgi:hypothetical protein